MAVDATLWCAIGIAPVAVVAVIGIGPTRTWALGDEIVDRDTRHGQRPVVVVVARALQDVGELHGIDGRMMTRVLGRTVARARLERVDLERRQGRRGAAQ